MPTRSDVAPSARMVAWVGALLDGSMFVYGFRGPAAPPPAIDEALLDVDVEVVASGFTMPCGAAVIGEEEHLQFETNRLVYLASLNDRGRMSVARFTFDDGAVRNLEVIVESNAFSIGSRFAWEDDEHFFVIQGMGGDPRPEPDPKDLAVDSGKTHRLLADGTVPPDNPVFDKHPGPTSIWSYGHRDPKGPFFDTDEGVLYSSEFNPLRGDELNVISKGGNYGWPLFSDGLNYDGTPVAAVTARRQSQRAPSCH